MNPRTNDSATNLVVRTKRGFRGLAMYLVLLLPMSSWSIAGAQRLLHAQNPEAKLRSRSFLENRLSRSRLQRSLATGAGTGWGAGAARYRATSRLHCDSGG